jgi:hypothetical protein
LENDVDGQTLLKEAKEYCKERGLRDPRQAFSTQRNGAKEREIEWSMTFDEWWEIWKPYYHMRGQGTNDLCMARNGDVGPYKVGNVYLTTKLGNSHDYHGPRSAAKQAQKERDSRYWGKDNQHSESISHRAFKIHCNPKKFVAL